MMADATSLFFHFREVERVVFQTVIVVPRHSIKTREFGVTTSDDCIGHANDRSGIHAATEFCEDRAIGPEAALHGLCKDGAKVLFVFGIRAVTDLLIRIEIPMLAGGMPSRS